jgi:thiamine-phosphate pyrophosphorylase
MCIRGIYLVAGLRFHPEIPAFLQAIEQSFKGGIRLFQLRLKNELSDREQLNLAIKVRQLTRRYHVTYFINDRPDIARLCEADGLHLGPEDLPVSEVKKLVGKMMIGKSSHSLEQAQSALKEDITYLSVGPVFETDCKKKPDAVVGTELLAKVLTISRRPIVAIGGISLENMQSVLCTGVGCCGMIRGIMQSGDIRTAAECHVMAFKRFAP